MYLLGCGESDQDTALEIMASSTLQRLLRIEEFYRRNNNVILLDYDKFLEKPDLAVEAVKKLTNISLTKNLVLLIISVFLLREISN